MSYAFICNHLSIDRHLHTPMKMLHIALPIYKFLKFTFVQTFCVALCDSQTMQFALTTDDIYVNKLYLDPYTARKKNPTLIIHHDNAMA